MRITPSTTGQAAHASYPRDAGSLVRRARGADRPAGRRCAAPDRGPVPAAVRRLGGDPGAGAGRPDAEDARRRPAPGAPAAGGGPGAQPARGGPGDRDTRRNERRSRPRPLAPSSPPAPPAPREPRQCHIAVVLTTAMSHRRGCPEPPEGTRDGTLASTAHVSEPWFQAATGWAAAVRRCRLAGSRTLAATMKIRPPNRPIGRVKSSGEVGRGSVDTM